MRTKVTIQFEVAVEVSTANKYILLPDTEGALKDMKTDLIRQLSALITDDPPTLGAGLRVKVVETGGRFQR